MENVQYPFGITLVCAPPKTVLAFVVEFSERASLASGGFWFECLFW